MWAISPKLTIACLLRGQERIYHIVVHFFQDKPAMWAISLVYKSLSPPRTIEEFSHKILRAVITWLVGSKVADHILSDHGL